MVDIWSIFGFFVWWSIFDKAPLASLHIQQSASPLMMLICRFSALVSSLPDCLARISLCGISFSRYEVLPLFGVIIFSGCLRLQSVSSWTTPQRQCVPNSFTQVHQQSVNGLQATTNMLYKQETICVNSTKNYPASTDVHKVCLRLRYFQTAILLFLMTSPQLG